MESLVASLNGLCIVDSLLSNTIKTSQVAQSISAKINHIKKNPNIKVNEEDIGFLVNQMNNLTNQMCELNIDEKIVDDISIKFKNAMLALIHKSMCSDVYGDFPIPPPYQEAY